VFFLSSPLSGCTVFQPQEFLASQLY
jgi:hypothetical protein